VTGVPTIGESYHSALVTHNFLGPVVTAAACAVDTSIPNFLTQEYSKVDEAPANAMLTSAWQRDGGFLNVPDEVGIGVAVDYAAFEASPYESRTLNVPIRVDGSVGYSV
jgi:galactonate dehydratase